MSVGASKTWLHLFHLSFKQTGSIQDSQGYTEKRSIRKPGNKREKAFGYPSDRLHRHRSELSSVISPTLMAFKSHSRAYKHQEDLEDIALVLLFFETGSYYTTY